jgi:probable rRNA maturation factor
MLTVEFSNRQTSLDVDPAAWRSLLIALFQAEGIRDGEVSVSFVNDREIHALNRLYLGHDYPTDVLSFVLERTADRLHGEIVVSAETAIARCNEFGWGPREELTLYLIHGALHLVGYDDKSSLDRKEMRRRETIYLTHAGLATPIRRQPPSTS